MSKVIKNTFIYTVGRILPQAVNFFLLPVYTSYLNPSEYGIVSSLRSFSVILTVLFTLSFTGSIYRLFFDYKTESEQKEYLSTTFISVFFISVIFLGLFFIFSPVVNLVYKSIPFYPYFSLFIGATFVAVFFEIPKIYFQVKQKGSYFLAISMLEFFTTTGLTLWFLVVRKEEAYGVLKASLYANVLILPVFLYITFKNISFKFSYNIFKNIFKFSIPAVPVAISYWIINLSDRIFIENYFDLNQVGIYSVSNKLAEIVLVLVGALSAAYSPVFYELANSNNVKESKKRISKFNSSYIILSGFIAFGISFFADEIIYFLIDEKYSEASKLIPILSVAYMISIISGLYNWMILQHKKSVLMMFIVVFAASVNILLNFILIKDYGMYGASWATLFSFVVSLIIKDIFARKCYYIPLNLFKLTGFFVILLVVYFVTVYLFEFSYYLISAKIIFMLFLTYYIWRKHLKQFIEKI